MEIALVDTSSAYDGTRMLRSYMHAAELKIEAGCEWRIEVRPIEDMRTVQVPGKVEGNGDDILHVVGPFDMKKLIANLTYSGDKFVLLGWESPYAEMFQPLYTRGLDFTQVVPVDTPITVIDVESTGAWSLDFSSP